VSKLKNDRFDVVQRTAGSHSPIDIIAINTRDKSIKLVQAKRTLNKPMDYIDPKLKEKIEKEFEKLNGFFWVDFEVL